MSKKLQAHLALITVSLIYAATFSVVKSVMPLYITSAAFVIVRVAGALVLFWVISTFVIREGVDNKDIPRLMLLGVFGVAINQSLFLKGLEYTTPINASIIMVSNPVFVLLISAFILKEGISFQKIVGIGFGITGALLLLLFNKYFSFGSETLFGDLMILLNSMSWAGYLVLVKPLMTKYNAFTIVKWVFFFGLIYALPLGIGELKEFRWDEIPPAAWCDIMFIVLGSTFIAYLLNTYALRALSPSTMSVYIYFQPFLTTLIAVFYYNNDALDIRKIVSGTCIIIGVVLVSSPFAKSK